MKTQATNDKQFPAAISTFSGVLQRNCACGTHTVAGGECQSCKQKKTDTTHNAVNKSTSSELVQTRTGETLSLWRQPPDIATNTFAAPDEEKDSSQPQVYTETEDVQDGGAPVPAQAPIAEFCSVEGSFTSIPSGKVAATLTGSKLGAAFTMVGEFVPRIPCNCSCGEYRQYVRGTFTADGKTVTHSLGGGRNLHATTFQEDGDVAAGTVYGHRAVRGTKSKFKNPDQATGCTFEGADEPGIASTKSGTVLAMDLDFKGDLIDTCHSDKIIATSSWKVEGTATIP
jgi:hypothetical protein